MKRKTTSTRNSLDGNGQSDPKKRLLDETIKSRFRNGLLDRATLDQYKQSYAVSAPYKHGVISPLINPTLLRSVRTEIQEHLSFTEKETDIYKIFQSGDLANLDGLDNASLSKLPSLLELRDALYSAPFRKFLSEVTGAGDLSGRKTDMAINVYTGGCHLLCHDDVIGSRRVSYILYLTDPDVAWQPSWGGALRLYPSTIEKDDTGNEVKVPSPDFSLSIPPAFNQLSFFTVQPGESFHDVEEVYYAGPDGEKGGKERVRMAISGWYHIPQEGEDGYEEGLEEKLAERSSLQQLQSSGDAFDRPQPQVTPYEDLEENVKTAGEGDQGFTEADLDFLLKYITPSYLTPDITEELVENFTTHCSLILERFLHDKFATRLREYIEQQEKESHALPTSSHEIEQKTEWKVSRPPHKQRYLYQQPRIAGQETESKTPIQELLEDLLPSQAFRKWLSVATGCSDLLDYNILARRFRRGEDYTLASGYEAETPRLEFTIGLTPTSGWEKERNEQEQEGEDEEREERKDGHEGEDGEANGKTKGEATSNTNGKEQRLSTENSTETDDHSVGGYEIYMAGDDDDDDDDDDDEEEEAEAGENNEDENDSSTKKTKKRVKSDPAIYKANSGADGDDGVLFSMAAGWNRMSIVLRDSGTLKFVKYVSRSAAGDRWDVTGEIGLKFDEMEVDEDEN
ncbi:Fe II 2-oxoglutarate-dependent dioxygenase [Histoplasma capsulatum var. duboisii H88]|uniref:uS12 prolyl 3,4-dihydroxylase n=1 Tax=Ajellomyces capsulatus (strain H88) TaxID=544711 RepID=A0A8A1LLK5_AJEC8|nr:Fe II 2-oxoglutarate-dependent dioxygenase [Histoplasma capsulatum var. duboisii H88]